MQCQTYSLVPKSFICICNYIRLGTAVTDQYVTAIAAVLWCPECEVVEVFLDTSWPIVIVLHN